MRVLDAFRPQGATWSGQVISSPPGPSGGPFMTHLLPGGAVPRVHGAQSPVPPRLPHFATPWSVHRLAAVAAGTYPPRRPPDAWSPGAPAPPGPCYWHVASGTPVGWRGGCLALGLVRGAVRHYCLGRCSALVVCARLLRPFRGAWAGAWCCVLPVSPFPPCVSCAVCGGPSRPGVPCPRSLVRHSMRSVRSAGSDRLRFWYSPRDLCVCVRSRSRGVSAPPPLPLVGVARGLRAVPVLNAGRALPLGPCPSAHPAPVPCSVWSVSLGGGGPVSLLPGLGLCAPRGVGLRVWGVPAPGGGVGGGGGLSPGLCGRGGQWGWGSPCLGPSLCLPWAGNKAGVLDVALAMESVAPILFRFVLACCLRARSVWRPGVLGRVGWFIVVPAGAGGWGVGAGPPPASLPGAAVLPGGGGITSSASGGGCGPAPPWLPSSLSGRGGLRPSAQPPFHRRRIPSRCMRSAGVLGQPRAPGAACRRQASLAGGEGEGRPVSRPSGGVARGPGGRGVVLPWSVPLPSLGG